MKTFICVLVIFALLCTFIFVDSFFISRDLSRLIDITDSLPKDSESFEGGGKELSETMEHMYSFWKKSSKKIAYVANYALIEGADEAIGELYGAYKAKDAEGFLPAAEKFKVSLERLKILFGVSFQSFA